MSSKILITYYQTTENAAISKATMAVCFHETRETIDLLRRVVDKLDENDGCISAEDLWDGVQWYVMDYCNSPLTYDVLKSK